MEILISRFVMNEGLKIGYNLNGSNKLFKSTSHQMYATRYLHKRKESLPCCTSEKEMIFLSIQLDLAGCAKNDVLHLTIDLAPICGDCYCERY